MEKLLLNVTTLIKHYLYASQNVIDTISKVFLSPPLTPGVKVPDKATLSGRPGPVGR